MEIIAGLGGVYWRNVARCNCHLLIEFVLCIAEGRPNPATQLARFSESQGNLRRGGAATSPAHSWHFFCTRSALFHRFTPVFGTHLTCQRAAGRVSEGPPFRPGVKLPESCGGPPCRRTFAACAACVGGDHSERCPVSCLFFLLQTQRAQEDKACKSFLFDPD